MNYHDTLPQTAAVSAIVRRIVFKLNAELHFNQHRPLTDVERAGLFDLGEASRMLDLVAILPGMAQHEERARRDLLELYAKFNPGEPDAGAEVSVNLHLVRT